MEQRIFSGMPMVRLIIPLILGIVFAFCIPLSIPSFVILISIAVLVPMAVLVHGKQTSMKWRGADGVIFLLILFLIGNFLVHFHSEKKELLTHEVPSQIVVHALSDAIVKENSIHFEAEIIAQKDSSWQTSCERIIVYLKRDPASEKIVYGDELSIDSKLTEIEAPKNPDEFNYKAFLGRKEIYHRVYCDEAHWKKTGSGFGNVFKSAALSLRRTCFAQLQKYDIKGDELSVATALLLGNSDQIDPNLIQAYSASGVLHVLSVSGMHVALIYVILLKLLSPLARTRRGKFLNYFLQLLFIWFYATLTGLCPSVLRSVTMLSIVILANILERRSNIVNSLAASAFLLLLFDPMLLFDAGFQLSYFAVGGIVLVQPKLAAWWEPKNFLLENLWTMITVTITAQLFTFPLGLYYFHQFPSYFLIANLIIIPLSTIILYCGIVFLSVSWLSILAKPIAILFGFLLALLNALVYYDAKLPGSVLYSGQWNAMEILLLFVIVIGMMLFLRKRRGVRLNYLLGSVCGLLIFFCISAFDSAKEKKMVFFSAGKNYAVGVIDGSKQMLVLDSVLAQEKSNIDFHISPWFTDRGFRDENVHLFSDSVFMMPGCKNDLIHITDNTLLKFSGTNCGVLTDEPDYLLMDRESFKLLNDIPASWKRMTILVNAELSERKRTIVKEYCLKNGIHFHDLKEEGALEIAL